MAGMNHEYNNELANYGASLITEIGLFDDEGNELTGELYERQPVSWTTAGDGSDNGIIRPTENIDFDIPEGTVVSGVRLFGENDLVLGEKDLVDETYSNAGIYTIVAENTGILHNVE